MMKVMEAVLVGKGITDKKATPGLPYWKKEELSLLLNLTILLSMGRQHVSTNSQTQNHECKGSLSAGDHLTPLTEQECIFHRKSDRSGTCIKPTNKQCSIFQGVWQNGGWYQDP